MNRSKQAVMAIKTVVALLLGLALASVHFAEAQQPAKNLPNRYFGRSIIFGASSRVEAFRKGLIELGYIEGKDIAIEKRYADGRLERLPELATE